MPPWGLHQDRDAKALRRLLFPQKAAWENVWPTEWTTRPGISFARWMSVRALGASTPRIQSFPGGLVPQPASHHATLLCSWELFLDYTGSEQQFGAISLLSGSNAAVRMLQKLFSLFLSLLFFFFLLPQSRRKTPGSSGLGSPGTLGSLVHAPHPMPHTQHPAPDRFVPPAEGSQGKVVLSD